MDDEAAFLRAKLKELTAEHAAFRAEAVALIEAVSKDTVLFPPQSDLARQVVEFLSKHKAH